MMLNNVKVYARITRQTQSMFKRVTDDNDWEEIQHLITQISSPTINPDHLHKNIMNTTL